MNMSWGGKNTNSSDDSVESSSEESKSLRVYRKGNNIFFNADVEPGSIEQLLYYIHESIHESTAQATVIKDIDITIHINSHGGDVASMFKFVDTLSLIRKSHPQVTFTTIIIPIAASAATFMALAGDNRYMTKNSVYMIHEIFSWNVGILTHQKSYMKYLEVVERGILDLYLEKCNLKEDEIRKMLLKESWLTPAEALHHGFINEII